MSCRYQWHSLPYHPSWVLEACPSCGLSTPTSCSWALIAVSRSMGVIYPGQLAARIGSDHWPPTSSLHGGSAVQGQGMWFIAVHCMHWPWDFLSAAGQGQLPPVFFPGLLCLSYKAICRWLLLVLDLEIPRWSQAVNLGWLLLVLNLGLTEASCCLLDRIQVSIHHYGTIQSIFAVLKILCALPIQPSPHPTSGNGNY